MIGARGTKISHGAAGVSNAVMDLQAVLTLGISATLCKIGNTLKILPKYYLGTFQESSKEYSKNTPKILPGIPYAI